MTYEERMTQFCENQCIDRKECEYVLCKNTFRCDYLSGIMYGWELGQKDTLEEIENIVYRRYSEDGDGTERNKDMIKLIKRLKGE